MKPSFNYKNIAKITGILLFGLFLGWLLFGGSSSDQPESMAEHVEEVHTDEQGNIVYTCSMHPSVRESEPGNCPICGMELIPVGGGASSDDENPYELKMTEAAMRLAEVQTTEVQRGQAVKKIRMPGKVVVDERRISNVTAHFPGRIKQLYVDFTGERVKKGERLASIYSPQLLSAQRELLETKKHKEQNLALYEATRRKLELWELPEEEINQIENSGEVMTEIDIVSPTSGYVLRRNISNEDHVMEGTVMYKIANLSQVWVVFNAYESDLEGLDVGDRVSFSVDAYPGETFRANVTYIDPTLDPQSRTVKVRAEAANPAGKLKPEMLAEGVISSTISNGGGKLLVPKSAVLWTGERSVVYVKKPNTEQPTFEFREVVLGQRVGDQYVVKSGLKSGEEVVTNGNFKIDSAAQLAGKASMMNKNPDGSMPAGHNHGEMDMESGSRQMDKEQASRKTFSGDHSVKVDKQAVPDAFKKELDALVDGYLKVKEALTGDDLERASSGIARFNETLSNIDMSLIKNGDQMKAWMTRQQALKKHADAVQQADDLDAFRQQFALLSEALAETLATFGVERELFVQFCPMARDGKGGYWVSSRQQIENPYMGQKMPGCGETKQELNPGS